MNGRAAMGHVGVVAIGRNEGQRLLRCLESAFRDASAVVYVDSGSTDGSPAAAEELGAKVLSLDLAVPFTAARARNAGLSALRELATGVEFVQFVDGDCELQPGWMERAVRTIEAYPKAAAVCGRRRERHPEASIYNALCDLEWNTPVGLARSCGGDALMRIAALEAVSGFRDSMIAGEEPELCVRLRGAGWTIHRIDAEMTLHDAAMTRFGQWWRRATRAGHAYAEGAWLHGRSPERHNVRPVVSALLWGGVLPLVGLALAWPTWGVSVLIVCALWLALFARVTLRRRRSGTPWREATIYGLFCILAKPAHVAGIFRFVWNRALRRRSALIEYKSTDGAARPAQEMARS